MGYDHRQEELPSMMDTPQARWMQPDYNAEARRYSRRRMRQAWRGLGLSALLLAIAAMTFSGLRNDPIEPTQHAVYIGILCLFIARFFWSAWRFVAARRAVTRFRSGVERQLRVSDIPKTHL